MSKIPSDVIVFIVLLFIYRIYYHDVAINSKLCWFLVLNVVIDLIFPENLPLIDAKLICFQLLKLWRWICIYSVSKYDWILLLPPATIVVCVDWSLLQYQDCAMIYYYESGGFFYMYCTLMVAQPRFTMFC